MFLLLVIKRALLGKQIKKEGADALGRGGQLLAEASERGGRSVLRDGQGPARPKGGEQGVPEPVRGKTNGEAGARARKRRRGWARTGRAPEVPCQEVPCGPSGRRGTLKKLLKGLRALSWEGGCQEPGAGAVYQPGSEGRHSKGVQ